MSEKYRHHGEAGKEHLDDLYEAAEPRQDALKPRLEAAEGAEEHNHSIDKLQESIHEAALSTEEISVEQPQHGNSSQPVMGLQRELKRDAYNKTIRKIHSQLAPAERSFSKLIHHRAVEPVSEIGAKTIARPSGILGGGIIALIGSSVVLFMAKHYGFEYNLSIFFILLGMGFVVGLLVELVGHLLRRNKT